MILCFLFFFKRKTASVLSYGLVGSEMCIRDSEGGESEAIIGDWLAGDRGADLVIATKVGFPGGRYDQSLSRDRILRSCEESPQRLQMERCPALIHI